MDELTIGQVAARSGVAPSALRYYEEQGLVSATRSPGGARRYPRSVLRRLAFVRAAQNVGLSLTEIREALATLPEGRPPTARDWARLSRGLARPARRADRGPRAAAGRADVLHRLRLPVAHAVPAAEPAGRRGRGGRGRPLAAPDAAAGATDVERAVTPPGA